MLLRSRTRIRGLFDVAIEGVVSGDSAAGAVNARRILVGFDGSESSAAALAWATRVALCNHGCLTVVLVLQTRWWSGWILPQGSPRQLVLELEERLIETLDATVHRLDENVSVVSLVAYGPVAKTLAREAERRSCDAIVVGRRRGLVSRATGGVARALPRYASMCVITAPVACPTVPNCRHNSAKDTSKPRAVAPSTIGYVPSGHSQP